MSVVNHNHQYIFMHEPHTGGRSIEKALMEQHEGSQDFNGEHHLCAIDMIDKEWVTEEQFERYKKFRVIRDPYEWLVTCWGHNDKVLTFDRWVFSKGLGFTAKGTLFWRYEGQVDYSISFENMENELNMYLQMHCVAPPVRLDRIGVTEDKQDWRDLLTVAQAKDMERLYPDILRYGYGIFR